MTTPALDPAEREAAVARLTGPGGRFEVGTEPVLGDVGDLAAVHPDAGLPESDPAEDDPAVALYTSGTTGRPKEAVHSHRNVPAACDFHLFNHALAAELGRPPGLRRSCWRHRCSTSRPCTTSPSRGSPWVTPLCSTPDGSMWTRYCG